MAALMIGAPILPAPTGTRASGRSDAFAPRLRNDPVQLFGRRHNETPRALSKSTSKKRQGTRSREVWQRLGSGPYRNLMSAPSSGGEASCAPVRRSGREREESFSRRPLSHASPSFTGSDVVGGKGARQRASRCRHDGLLEMSPAMFRHEPSGEARLLRDRDLWRSEPREPSE
jgi:hypothetical protein